MNYFILASHGTMAKGIKNTVEVIIGIQENMVAYSFDRHDGDELKFEIEKCIEEHYVTKNIYVLTDIFGGSVNNDVLLLLEKYPNINILTGINLPLVMSLIVLPNKITARELQCAIEESRNGLIDCGALVKNTVRKEEML